MLSTTSITAAGLTLSTLFLSANANPILARQNTYAVSCPSDGGPFTVEGRNFEFQKWCTSLAVSVVCDASGHKTYDAAVVDSLKDPRCDACTCVVSQPSSPPPPTPPPTLPVICPNDGNTDFLAGIPGQSVGDLTRWCMSPVVSHVCDASGHISRAAGVDALEDPHCDVCICGPPQPTTPEKPTPAVETKPSTTPQWLSTVDKINPNLQEWVGHFESQPWCTKPEVNAVCIDKGLEILGNDKLHVCKVACKC